MREGRIGRHVICRLLVFLNTRNAGKAGVFKPEVVEFNLAQPEPRDIRLDPTEGAATGILVPPVDSVISKYTLAPERHRRRFVLPAELNDGALFTTVPIHPLSETTPSHC